MSNRTVLTITGADRVDFLDGLITNSVKRAADGIIYAALLTPQGKFIADFFVVGHKDALIVDVDTTLAPILFQRLSMYRLRADVKIAESPLVVSRGTGAAPVGALVDPRHPDLGWRLYSDKDVSDDTDWTALRVTHMIPESGIELTPDTYILEANFEALHGVDFKKGCFVGQEIVARMKHKTELKKGLRRVRITGTAQTGDEITANGKTAGTLYSISGDTGLAFLRFDRTEGMETQKASLTLQD